MEVISLVENTSIRADLWTIPGLSFYIKTAAHQILFDLGPKGFLRHNAGTLGIGIADIDGVVISHGHDDHGGDLPAFLEMNTKAKIYLQESSFDSYFAEVLGQQEYIGLDYRIKNHPQVQLISGNYEIDESLYIFSDVEKGGLMPSANKTLYKKTGEHFANDDFSHEQSLIVKEQGRYYLFAGCAHSGILNIVKRAETLCGCEMSYVFGGFHLCDSDTLISEAEEKVIAMANELKKRSTRYYTCHCTGEEAFGVLKKQMGEQIQFFSGGMGLQC